MAGGLCLTLSISEKSCEGVCAQTITAANQTNLIDGNKREEAAAEAGGYGRTGQTSTERRARGRGRRSTRGQPVASERGHERGHANLAVEVEVGRDLRQRPEKNTHVLV